jgi:hypothetical protein
MVGAGPTKDASTLLEADSSSGRSYGATEKPPSAEANRLAPLPPTDYSGTGKQRAPLFRELVVSALGCRVIRSIVVPPIFPCCVLADRSSVR